MIDLLGQNCQQSGDGGVVSSGASRFAAVRSVGSDFIQLIEEDSKVEDE
jgi:hypothetical protein